MRWHGIALFSLVTLVSGCGKKKDGQPPSSSSSAASTTAPGGAWSGDAKKLLSLVPDKMMGVAVIDLPVSFWDASINLFGFVMTPEERAALDKDLRAFMKEKSWPDMTQVKTVAVALDPMRKESIVLIAGVKGALPRSWEEELATEDVKVRLLENVMLIGTAESVATTGTSKSSLAAELAKSDGAPISTLGSLEGLPMPIEGLKQISARASAAGLHVRLTGSDDALKQVQSMIEAGLASGKAEVTEELADMKEHGELPQFASIWGSHLFNSMFNRVQVAREGEALVVNVRIEAGGVYAAALVGVLAAVAVPSFMKYTSRAKTSEAREFVKKIYDGARAYHMDPMVEPSASMDPVPPHFPKVSTEITPPLGTCCKQGGKCLPDFNLWTAPTWVELQFSIDDPHYYSYQYEVAKDGKSFTVRAFGDLDCDGIYSTFTMIGELQGDDLPGTALLKRENELE